MKIFLAADHAGFQMKEELKSWLAELGQEVVDLGANELDPDDDYPDFVLPLANEISNDPDARGIVCAGSGQGEAMAANRFKNVRATAYSAHNLDIVRLSREHNDANVFSIGARFVSLDEAKEAITSWLETDLSNDPRHARRIKKFEDATST